MDIKLGMQVVASDGVSVGHVDRLILEPDSGDVFGIIAHKGHYFSQDRVIEHSFIDETADEDAVHLRIDAAEADRLPRFVTHEFVTPTHEQLRTMPYPLEGGVSGGGVGAFPVLWRSTYSGQGYQPATRGLMESVAVDPSTVQLVSNLPDDVLLVGKGTDVIAADGKKVGRVDDVIYAPDGTIDGYLVRAGLFHHHDIVVPAAMVASITHEHLHVRMTSDEFAKLPPVSDTTQPATA